MCNVMYNLANTCIIVDRRIFTFVSHTRSCSVRHFEIRRTTGRRIRSTNRDEPASRDALPTSVRFLASVSRHLVHAHLRLVGTAWLCVLSRPCYKLFANLLWRKTRNVPLSWSSRTAYSAVWSAKLSSDLRTKALNLWLWRWCGWVILACNFIATSRCNLTEIEEVRRVCHVVLRD